MVRILANQRGLVAAVHRGVTQPGRQFAGGAEVVLNLYASPYHRGKVAERERLTGELEALRARWDAELPLILLYSFTTRDATAEAIAREARGNPLFLRELARAGGDRLPPTLMAAIALEVRALAPARAP